MVLSDIDSIVHTSGQKCACAYIIIDYLRGSASAPITRCHLLELRIPLESAVFCILHSKIFSDYSMHVTAAVLRLDARRLPANSARTPCTAHSTLVSDLT